LKEARWTIIIFIMSFFIVGCVRSPITDKPNDRVQKRKSLFEKSLSDADIIREILISLDKQGGESDYNAVKAKLAIFIDEYPQSKWAGSARALILTINKLLALQETVKTQSLALDKENAEKTKLKNDYQFSEERDRVEISKLQQENVQLKKDIALLKKLEIQLDRREKMLR
jgi:hypothetical protein